MPASRQRRLRNFGLRPFDPRKTATPMRKITQIAARYKAQGGISYADCFAAALCVRTASGSDRASCFLLTGDQEFKRVEDEITITWL